MRCSCTIEEGILGREVVGKRGVEAEDDQRRPVKSTVRLGRNACAETQKDLGMEGSDYELPWNVRSRS